MKQYCSSMRKVCHLSTVHQPHDTRIFHKEIFSLANAGYFVIYIVRKGTQVLDHPRISYKFLEDPKNLVDRIINVLKAFRIALSTKCSIYHFHDPELIPIGLLLKLLTRKKIIYDIHELYSDALLYKSYFNRRMGQCFSKLYVFIEKLALNFFDQIVLAEENYKDFYRDRDYTVIQNFLPQKYILKEKKRVIEFNHLNFVYLGGISKVRGVEEVLNFALMLKNSLSYKLHLIGPIQPTVLEQRINEFIESNDLGNNIILYGRVPYHRAQWLLNKFDIGLLFLHPILNNMTILSTKMFEYMGKGLPIIMTNFPLWEEFNQNYHCGLTIDIFDLDGEKKRICDFLQNWEMLQKIGKNNVENVMKNFTWEIEEKKLLDIYGKLLVDK